MNVILKELIHCDYLYHQHLESVTKALFEAIKTNDNELLKDSKSLQSLCIESILKDEILSIFHDKKLMQVTTRRQEHLINNLLFDCHKLRQKRLRNEHYLRNSFYMDVTRSKNELHYILEKESL